MTVAPVWRGKDRAMKQGYTYEYRVCSKCGERVPFNWYVRHMKEKHPNAEKRQRIIEKCTSCGGTIVYRSTYRQCAYCGTEFPLVSKRIDSSDANV